MKIHLWQGDADSDAPEQMGRYYASAIPSCDARFYPGEGYMIFFSHAEEILKTLMS